MSRSDRTFCFSQNQTTYSVAFLVTAWLVIVEGFGVAHGCADHAIEGKRQSPIYCCDVTKPPYLFSGELCTAPLQSKRLFVYTVCCRHGCLCFFVLRTRKSDAILTQWEKLRHQAVTQCATLAHPWCSPCQKTVYFYCVIDVSSLRLLI